MYQREKMCVRYFHVQDKFVDVLGLKAARPVTLGKLLM